MQNTLTYEDLGYLFDEIYDEEIGDLNQQTDRFISRLCQGYEEMYVLARQIWCYMIDVYEGKLSSDEELECVQIIKSKLSQINEFLEENKRFYKYEDLLELVEKVANQEHDSPDEERQAFALRLCKDNKKIFPIAEDIWFHIINIEDGVIAEPERDQYIAIVNSRLGEINEFLDDPEKINDYEDLLQLLDDIAKKGLWEFNEVRYEVDCRLSKGHEELYDVINEIFDVFYKVRGLDTISEEEKNKGISFINSKLDEINKFLETKKNIQKSSEVKDEEKLDEQQGSQIQQNFA